MADRRVLNPKAGRALDRLKYEVASELGLWESIRQIWNKDAYCHER